MDGQVGRDGDFDGAAVFDGEAQHPVFEAQEDPFEIERADVADVAGAVLGDAVGGDMTLQTMTSPAPTGGALARARRSLRELAATPTRAA